VRGGEARIGVKKQEKRRKMGQSRKPRGGPLLPTKGEEVDALFAENSCCRVVVRKEMQNFTDLT